MFGMSPSVLTKIVIYAVGLFFLFSKLILQCIPAHL